MQTNKRSISKCHGKNAGVLRDIKSDILSKSVTQGHQLSFATVATCDNNINILVEQSVGEDSERRKLPLSNQACESYSTAFLSHKSCQILPCKIVTNRVTRNIFSNFDTFIKYCRIPKRSDDSIKNKEYKQSYLL